MKSLTYKDMMVCVALLAFFPAGTQAQNKNLIFRQDDKKHGAIVVDRDTVHGDYNNGWAQLTVMSQTGYTAEPVVTDGQTPFFTVKKAKEDQLQLAFGYNYKNAPLQGKMRLTAPDGYSREVVVSQDANTSANEVQTDVKLTIASGQASQAQSGEGIERSFDGDMSTIYHSPWSGTTMPVVLTYTLSKASHVDYMVYHPRQSGGSNGMFGRVKIEYATGASSDAFVLLTEADFGQSSSSSVVRFGDEGIDNVKKVRVTVNSGYGNFASCAEMEFYQRNLDMQNLLGTYFEDALCTRLKEGVTAETAARITDPYVKQLVYIMLDGRYDTAYRVGEYEAYRTLNSLASQLKTNTYNAYENPTGLYFTPGKPIVAFVEGVGDDPVMLKIKNFGKATDDEAQAESSYVLYNGVNVINPRNRGNGYVAYYTDAFETAPNVKIHFAMADVNGYFDLERGDTNEDWQRMLANACSDIMDMRTKRIQVAFPTARFRQNCPVDAVALALNLDSVIYHEREIMGLVRYGTEPKNRQFARVVWSGFMFADGVGAAAHDNSVASWMKSSRGDFEFWGIAHELGHVNQLRPSLKWVGCGETTNNIYSAWVQFKLGTGWLRLESEVTGIGDYSGMKGGRFNAHLENGVRKGISWQLQEGPDYYGSSPSSSTVKNEDYAGNRLSQDTVVQSRNYDHFVKLVPLWQLQLYCHQCGYAPDVYAKVMETLRNASDNKMSNGMHQLRFIRLVCDSTGLNFLPFFEKAGMLRPINAYIEDYSREWLKISQEMIDELKAYVEAQGYPLPEGEVNYISGNNWRTYAEKLPLEGGALNAGCTKASGRIQVSHSVWRNAVAFETYDKDGNLLRISMQGLGAPQSSNSYTQVLWPQSSSERAAYIMAVGWDGTRIKCYEP